MIDEYSEFWEYRSIDGNWTRRPVAYCSYRHAVLTRKQMKVHQCERRKCKRLREFKEECFERNQKQDEQ